MMTPRNALARNWFEKIGPVALARQSDGLPTVWRANVKGISFFALAASVEVESWIAGRRTYRPMAASASGRMMA